MPPDSARVQVAPVGLDQLIPLLIEQVGGHAQRVVAHGDRGAGHGPRGLPDAARQLFQGR